MTRSTTTLSLVALSDMRQHIGVPIYVVFSFVLHRSTGSFACSIEHTTKR